MKFMKKLCFLILILGISGCIDRGEKEFKELKKLKECVAIYSDIYGVTVECHISKEDVPRVKSLMKDLQDERK